MDTIFALATVKGRSGVAIFRISGDESVRVAQNLSISVPNQMGLRVLKDLDGSVLDEALVLYFPKGRSFTGEETVELQVHGSPAIIQRLETLLSSWCRRADAGEFSRRALENGRMDLAQVEGLADLIDAETEAQRRQAVRVFSGQLSETAENMRASLIRSLALVEATIDFADEDIPEDVFPEVNSILDYLTHLLADEIDGSKIRERVRDGFEVAIVGKPNTGKSTLLNRLAGREAAITSEIAGTTRDVIEVSMDLSGLPITILDTAGLRESDDLVEQKGILRAIERANAADLRIVLGDHAEFTDLELEPDDIRVAAKIDENPTEAFGISGRTGEGIDELLGLIERRLGERIQRPGVAMRERHRLAMVSCLERVRCARDMIDREEGVDLIAAELYLGVKCIDSIVGRIDVEDLLDDIFASFCIGK